MAPPFAQQTKKTTTQSSTSGGPPGLTSSRRAGPPAPPGKSRAQIAKELDREITRRTYFDGRQDVSDDRLDRRLAQAQEYQKFKSDPTKTKLVSGSTNLYQAATPGGITLAQKQMQLANKYGPTFSEIMSDVTYAGGKVLGALGERAMSGSLGIFGAIKDVANYALNKANQGYDKLNSVQQEIFDNPDKYPYASKVPQVEAVNNSRELALEAERDALGLELDELIRQRETEPTVDLRSAKDYIEDLRDDTYVESGRFKQDLEKSGILTVDDPSTQEPLSDNTKIPGQDATIGDFKQALQNQGFNDLQIQSAVNEITRQILSGSYTGDFDVEIGSTTVEPEEVKEKSEISVLGAFNPFDEIPTGMAINELINPEQQNLEQFKKEMNQGFIDDQSQVDLTSAELSMYNDLTPSGLERFNENVSKGMSSSEALAREANVNSPYYQSNFPELFQNYRDTYPEIFKDNRLIKSDDQASLSTVDGTQVTAYNNPGNLQFAGQQGAIEGQTYGNNFAVFPNAEAGISALKNDLLAKVNRSNKVDDIIGEYAPKEDNPQSFNNYVSFVKDRVGDTVEPNELDDLTRSVIQFENKPDIANQYLNLLDQPTLVADASKRDIQTLKPIRDMGIGYDMGVDMFKPVIRDLKEKNPSLTDEEIRGIIEGTITEPTGVFAADGGMIDKQLKSLQNGLQNMYNGIPSVRRR